MKALRKHTQRTESEKDPEGAGKTNNLLEVSKLQKSFGGNAVIKQVSLTLRCGEVVGLLGANGAGKTTLLNLISGQERCDDGTITFDGIDLTAAAPSHPARHEMIRGYQDAGLFPRLSTLENVMVPVVARGVSRRQALDVAHEALWTVGLAKAEHERADRLSGGQRKLVDFARTLAVRPRLGLLDEPTAGVHSTLGEHIGGIIREQSRRGVAWLVVTHDLPWALEVCSRVVFLALGTVLIDDTPTRVSDDPRVREAFLT